LNFITKAPYRPWKVGREISEPGDLVGFTTEKTNAEDAEDNVEWDLKVMPVSII
jgi:hypothetical protein